MINWSWSIRKRIIKYNFLFLLQFIFILFKWFFFFWNFFFLLFNLFLFDWFQIQVKFLFILFLLKILFIFFGDLYSFSLIFSIIFNIRTKFFILIIRIFKKQFIFIGIQLQSYWLITKYIFSFTKSFNRYINFVIIYIISKD